MSDRYITKAEYTQAKSRLTRAENKAKKAATTAEKAAAYENVVWEVNHTLNTLWADKAWPDNWHRWNIAREDAITALHYLKGWG